jgi:hypothetical protein
VRGVAVADADATGDAAGRRMPQAARIAVTKLLPASPRNRRRFIGAF